MSEKIIKYSIVIVILMLCVCACEIIYERLISDSFPIVVGKTDKREKELHESHLIHKAAEDNLVTLAKILVFFGEDVNKRTYFNKTPLIIASINGNMEMVSFLIEKGADVNASCSEGVIMHGIPCLPTLAGALAYHHYKVAELLLKRGFDISGKKSDFDILSYFVCKNEYSNVKWLIEHGAKAGERYFLLVNAVECLRSGETKKETKKRIAIIDMLLNLGEDINQNSYGTDKKAIHFAVEENNVLMLKYLISKGADIDPVDADGNTPLLIALKYGKCNAGIVKLLINSGADVYVNSEEGYDPLHYATECRNFEEILPLFYASKIYGRRCLLLNTRPTQTRGALPRTIRAK